MNTLHKQKEWLLQFYPLEKLDKLTDQQLSTLYTASQPERVRIDSLKNTSISSYQVNSEDGFVNVNKWRNKGRKPCVVVSTANGLSVTASTDHFFELSNGKWKYARYLQAGDLVKTEFGVSEVETVFNHGEQTVYDFHINHENHRYYTNGISSHNSGSGKSLFMANLGVNWALAGMNVMYLTFELSEQLVSMRIDSMVTEINSRDIFKSIDDVEMKVKMIGKKSGAMQVKYMPSGKTPNDIRSYIKEYEIKTGRKVDALLIDYLDLLHPNGAKISAENLFIKDKYVSEELRNLAMELDTIFVTASQLNRCLTLGTEVEVKGKGTIQIKNIAEGDLILSDSGYNKVTNVFPITKQKVYQVKTKSGKTIRCSAEHIFPTADGEKKINTGLSVGDILYRKDK